ncbi:MAG TPA: quaternary ammonium compound efflux SMR transporter SugE [Candidatus Aphodousia faecigallinarum]|uniref:Guanidinium exporter n=1 Tax=Candidatus Aphodousia faecigallinarum TaxID=2840677 RepID=A0A9D1IJK2_9BURK|nr:quaternary ammonium compound efflux SMR transporter SugE [Candidatus Aphodousia faecigallinarum]
MAWLFLFLAGLTEIGWAIALKYSHGFTRLFPSVIAITVMVLSFFLLAHSLKSIPIGTAYAVWTGIGIMGTVILGIFLFNEPVNFSRLLFLSFILIGIVGLKITQ